MITDREQIVRAIAQFRRALGLGPHDFVTFTIGSLAPEIEAAIAEFDRQSREASADSDEPTARAEREEAWFIDEAERREGIHRERRCERLVVGVQFEGRLEGETVRANFRLVGPYRATGESRPLAQPSRSRSR